MERSPKYIFDIENWKPKLANDGRPCETWFFDSWGTAIKTWREDTRISQISVIEAVRALIEILQATEEKNAAQGNAWYKSRTRDEMITMMIGDRVR